MEAIDLPAIESIGKQALCSCPQIQYLKLPDTLKFTGEESFLSTDLHFARIPHFTHFLPTNAFKEASFLNLWIADSLSLAPEAFKANTLETLNIACHGRTNNIKGALSQIDSAINKGAFKNLNITIGDSIKDLVTIDYIKDILAINGDNTPVLSNLHGGRCFLDFSNTNIPEADFRSLALGEGHLPWVLSLPHIEKVDGEFNALFKQLHGVILTDAEAVAAGAFEGCSNLNTIGFGDTVTFEEDALVGVSSPILELIVSRPENFASFLGDLNAAGLDFSDFPKIILKLSRSATQEAPTSLCVANLLSALPPPPPKFPRIPGFLALAASFT